MAKSSRSPKSAARSPGPLSGGLRRIRRGRGFSYQTSRGKPVRSSAVIERIESLKIPPAWSDVRISTRQSGRLQAIGYDARGRRQYLYHTQFRARRESAKFRHLHEFAQALPAIRRRVARDLRRPAASRRAVLAAAIRLLDAVHLRIGNEEYQKSNDSYGLTTLRNRHAQVHGTTVRFAFRGKSGVQQRIEVRDARLARVLRRCLQLPGRDLLVYVDDEKQVRDVTAEDVNDYLRELAGEGLTTKEFRTWGGTVLAVQALRGRSTPTSDRDARRQISQAIEEVSDALHNTKAVCRRSYVHPQVLTAYESGRLAKIKPVARAPRGLSRDEQLTFALIRSAG
jgi:DNA topoisomerase-1